MGTSSTGYGGRMLDRTLGLLRHYRRNRRFARADYAAFAESNAAFERHAGRGVEGARILDLGCGQRFPATLLFHSLGALATGIDTDVVGPFPTGRAWWRMLRESGFERVLKTAVRRALFDREYYRELGRLARRPLRFRGLDLRVMDARALAFPDGAFDFVHSVAVFEHLIDVPGVLAEMARVLRPEGLGFVEVHLFPSLSGGHHPDWLLPDEVPRTRVPPWDHLRERRHPADAYLNRWRERQYLEAFERRFTILERRSRREGERFLTPDLARGLSAYSRDELLTRTLSVVLRPRRP